MANKKERLWARRNNITKGDYIQQHKLCSICHQHFDEWGNNAEPVNSGRCCNRCTTYYVIPERIRRMMANGQT